MAIKRMNKEEILEKEIGGLGGIKQEDAPAPEVETPKVHEKLKYYGKSEMMEKEANKKLDEEKHLSRLGEKIGEKSDIRDGWMEVDRNLLGERAIYYPEDWQFRIKPATVEAIRNWSTIDEQNPNSIDTVFDEILKSCLSIRTANGPQPWSQINTWDRLFFVLLIREYTFEKGESKVEFKRACPNCGTDMTFTLTSQSLMYDIPEEDVLSNYNREKREWHILPEAYDVEYNGEEVVLYLPTRDKDNAIKDYIYSIVQQDRNIKMDRVFYKFLPWMLPKVSKDINIAKSQIKKAELEFNSWDVEMFSFMDNVLTNISVTPSTTISGVCESCGEEATAPIQFPDGIASLFAVSSGFKKFGKK